MKKILLAGSLVVMAFLIGSANLCAEEPSRAFDVKYLFETTGSDWEKSQGLELAARWPVSKEMHYPRHGIRHGYVYAEGFLDILPSELKSGITIDGNPVDIEGDCSTKVLGGSAFITSRSEVNKVTWYLGGGIAYYMHDFSASGSTKNNLSSTVSKILAQRGVTLLSYSSNIEIENTFGFHINIGMNIELNPKASLDLSYRMNSASADMKLTSSMNTSAGSAVSSKTFTVNREGMLGIGVTVRF
jgi:opacity protein-like surface antigen